jgi:hypothetical protein
MESKRAAVDFYQERAKKKHQFLYNENYSSLKQDL